ncbi:methionine--tRNA ligase [Plantactinospora sp. S1510]|uniref:methionine--tRNA ligase n=1 Tax=Plantactinospora alkalitolerans TaxID=2789879 RepID=A0ABS0H461_9ACTN|nr:methionine--tRNA ligase [Plantactinospora alkalitolerans]MBF9133247.1 methionine--tRNA ligase [Plantactinospora alkalitolerans]
MPATAYVSTTIPYVNARPHLGHAFEYVQADSISRHLTRTGHEVYFLTGSDENSLKNVLAAEKAGMTTQALVDRNVSYFGELLASLGVVTTAFIRTSIDPLHLAGAAEIWRRLDANDDIYPKDYAGLYCVGCEQFYEPSDLVDGKCPEHLVEPEPVSERNYFFRLSRYGDQLAEAIESGLLQVHPQSRRNETLSFIRSGLADISISRSATRARGWGIPVPGDPSQVMYVWIDALTNYINTFDWLHDDTGYHRYWTGAERRIHVLGKGVLRFHAVYWPAMLLAAELPLPTDVMVHGYITSAGQKLSKSLGNATDPEELVGTFGQDAVRYYLLAEFSPFGDGDYAEERLVARYNNDLANGVGNLVSRLTSMVERYRGGVVPTRGEAGALEADLESRTADAVRDSVAAMDRFDHREALARIAELVRRSNAYVGERAPWHLAKAADAGDDDAARTLDTVLYCGMDAVRRIAILLRPYIPAGSGRLLDAVGEDPTADFGSLTELAGRKVGKAGPVFPRLES